MFTRLNVLCTLLLSTRTCIVCVCAAIHNPGSKTRPRFPNPYAAPRSKAMSSGGGSGEQLSADMSRLDVATRELLETKQFALNEARNELSALKKQRDSLLDENKTLKDLIR